MISLFKTVAIRKKFKMSNNLKRRLITISIKVFKKITSLILMMTKTKINIIRIK